jgi:endonuclease/exonuclease/phosphatase (EEP) superfamily protein YafD
VGHTAAVIVNRNLSGLRCECDSGIGIIFAGDANSISDCGAANGCGDKLMGGKNKQYQLAAKTITDKNPDLIFVSEITPKWEKELDKRLNGYPYRIVETHLGGVAIYSKLPLTESQIFYVGPIKRPGILAHVAWHGDRISLLNVHTVTPFNEFTLRNQELDDMAGRAAVAGEAVILAGDLNCSPWSSYFHRLEKKANLADTEQGFGPCPSWSTHHRIPMVPIDHCLVRGFRCTGRRVLTKIGSDHLPILVKLQSI